MLGDISMDLLESPRETGERSPASLGTAPPLRCVRVLSALAARRLLPAAVHSRDTLAACGHHVARALRQANDRAWVAAQVLLGGEPLWERAQLTWQRSLDADFYRPLRALLDSVPEMAFDEDSTESQEQIWQSLEEAVRSGLLTAGPLDLMELLRAPDLPPVNGAGPEVAEWRALDLLAESLEQAGFGRLRCFLKLRHGDGGPLLVLLVTALFQHAVATDPDLFGHLPDQLAGAPAVPEDLRALAVALDRHRPRLDVLLGELRRPVAGTAAELPADTNAAAVRMQRGLACSQRGEYERAIVEYTAALQLEPTLAAAFARRADSYRLGGAYALALADYDAALRLQPDDVLALLNRGLVHGLLGRQQAAIADYTAVLQIDPQHAAALHNRGKAHAANGDLEAALADFDAALRVEAESPWLFHDRGDVYASRGEHAAAIADYSQALRLNPAAALTHLRRGDAHRHSGNLKLALADYSSALRLDPFHALAHLQRGIVHRELGQFDAAVADFTKALALDPGNAELFHQRGQLLRLQG